MEESNRKSSSSLVEGIKRGLKRLKGKEEANERSHGPPIIVTEVDRESPFKDTALGDLGIGTCPSSSAPQIEVDGTKLLPQTGYNSTSFDLSASKQNPQESQLKKVGGTAAEGANKILVPEVASTGPEAMYKRMDGVVDERPTALVGVDDFSVSRSVSAPVVITRARSQSASSYTQRLHTSRASDYMLGTPLMAFQKTGQFVPPKNPPIRTPTAATDGLSLFSILEQSMDVPARDGIVIFSGGSAANSISDVFETLGRECGSAVTYLIGVSDNGGSTSEIIRMIGGPGIGDIRSRLVRLIPEPHNGRRIKTQKAQENIRDMMNLRLNESDQDLAQHEFDQLCAGAHPLWEHVETERKEFIRNIFITMQAEILKRTRYPSSRFNFCNASIGNLFLTGARLFTGSVESAIWLMRKACNIPDEVAEVWPVISRNFTSHIAASLENGDVIIGQNDISHPSKESEETKSLLYTEDFYAPDDREDANWPGAHKRLKGGDVFFDKSDDKELEARINRVWYVNPYGHEVRHRASQKVVEALESARVVVYSIGSFWTSLIPTVLPHPTPGLLSEPNIQAKVFLLNNALDREVSPHQPTPYRASTFLIKLAEQLHYCLPLSHSQSRDNVDFTPEVHVKLFVTHIFVMNEIDWHSDEQDMEALMRLGVKRVAIKSVSDKNGNYYYDLHDLELALKTIYEEEIHIV